MDLTQIKKKELLRFLAGGGCAVITDYFMFQLFLSFGMHLSMSKMISFFCGAVVGFFINKLWTFESRRFHTEEVKRYIILYAFSAGINAVVNKIFLYVSGYALFSFFCATGASTVINFLGQKFFVFRRRQV